MSSGENTTEEDADEESELVKFLTKRGTLEMICVIGDAGASPSEIKEKVHLSHGTVSNRLKKGEVIHDVWSRQSTSYDSQYTYMIQLDEVGRNVKTGMDEVGMVEAFHQLLPYREALNESAADAREWIRTNEDRVESKFTQGNVDRSGGSTYDVDSETNNGDSTPQG